MKEFYTHLCLFLGLTFQAALFAQKPVTLNFEKSNPRQVITVNSGQTLLTLTGLEPGKHYEAVCNPATADQPAKFKIFAVGATVFDPQDLKPQRIHFLANADLMPFRIFAETKEMEKQIPMFLSLRCTDCPGNDDWLQQFASYADANLATTGGIAASSLVTNTLIGGNCFDVTNITSAGNTASRGTFTNGATNIGIASGVVLCTGNVNTMPGPNNANNSGGGSFNTNSADDPDLATLTATNQFDVSKIEFDFTPTAPLVKFDFVFGSEEYCEYVNSNFNDVFGFFVSGPGITGNQNIALIPSTTTAVAINNVNHLTNPGYYVNNNNWVNGGGQPTCVGLPVATLAECQLDGWTTTFTAEATVIPCSTYHIKLAIADIGDAIFSSAVFLKANSFDAGGGVKAEPVYPIAGTQFVYEGCSGGYIKFTRQSGDLSQPLEVNFTISPSSTATPGDDYATLISPIIIPANQSSIQIPINVFADLIVEGDETITILLDNPCSCTQQPVTFVIKDKPPLEATLSDITSCGGTSTTLSPAVSGGLAPLTYLWSNNATTATINVNAIGTNTYTVTVTDNCGGTTTAQAVVSLLPVPTATLSGSGFFCEGAGGSVNLNINMTGEGPWDVTWSVGGSQTTETFSTSPGVISVADPGTYTLVAVSSANGCTGTVSGNVNLQEYDVNVNLNGINPSCFGSTNGSITTSVSGGTGPYTYIWSPSGSGANPTGLGPGVYNVTVSESHGCTDEATITLDEPPLLTAQVVSSANIDCNNPVGNADLEVNGGTPGYTYNWSSGSGSEDPNFTNGGTFTVTVTDSKGCTKTATVTIVANTTLPTATIAPPPQINCNVTVITLNGTGSSQGANFSYEWGGPGFVCCETTLQPQVDQPGTYTLTITNSDNGCTKTASVTVVANNTPPNAVANSPGNIGCNTPTITLNGNGSATGAGISYQWSTGDGNIISGGTTLNPVVNQAGTYTIVVTNANTGCTNEASVTITGNTVPPVATIAPPQVVDCDTPEIDLDASGSSQGSEFTYNWSTTGGSINSGGNTTNPTIDEGGTYTITVTNTLNNCTATATIVVAENFTQPLAVATAPGPITCATPELTLSGTGSSSGSNFSYEWSGPGLTCCETTLQPQINAPGTYTITVTNTDNGCTKTASVTISENTTPPNAVANSPFNIGCTHPTVTLTGVGSSTGSNFTYQWSTGDGNIVSGGNTLNPVVNQAGTYTIVVTNTSTGCTNEASVTITGNTQLPSAVIAPPGIVDCYTPEIDLDASGSSQGSEFTYNWSTVGGSINSGANTTNPTIDEGGTYTITVTNTENNCTATATVVVPENLTPPLANATTPGSITCQNPVITLSGAGSSTGSNFSYQWTTNDGNIVSGDNTLNPDVNQGGTYTLVVTNVQNGCTAQDAVVVTEAANIPNSDAGDDKVLNCYTPTVQLNGSASTGPGLSFQWSANPGSFQSGQNTLTPTVNAPGVYTLIVTNSANGCTSEDVVEVTSNFDTPDAQILPPAVITCFEPEIEIDGSLSTSGPEIDYTWTTNNGSINGSNDNANVIVDAPGTYTLLVTNMESGCTDVAQVTVTQNITPPVAQAGNTIHLTCQSPEGTLNGAGSSVGPAFEYQWDSPTGNIINGATTLTPVVDQAGIYYITVTNNINGCTATDFVNVTADQNFPIASAGEDLELNCQTPIATINGMGSTAGTGITYSWTANPGNIVSGGNTRTPKVNQAGIYTLLLTNTTNGCTATDEVEVWDNIIYPEPQIAPAQELNCLNTSVDLDASASFTTGSANFQWSTANGNIVSGNGGPVIEVDEPGTYTLVITNTDNYCSATQQISVTQDIVYPVAAAVPTGSITCQFPQLELSGQGSSVGSDYFYNWTTTNGNIISGEFTLNPTINQPGTYILHVTNWNNNCESTATVLVQTSQAFPVASAGNPQSLTCAVNQLTLDGSQSSQGSQYVYVWSTQNGNIVSGGNTLSPLVNAPGQYTLNVVNSQNGCVSVSNVMVGTNYTAPVAVVAPGGILSCTVTSLTLDGNGSSPGNPFTYNWTTTNGNILTGANTLNPIVNGVGNYTLVVTNNVNGCTSSAGTAVLADANLPVAVAGPPDTLTCDVLQITLNGTSSNQGSQYAYQWAGPGIVSGETTLQPLVEKPGEYKLTVTNTSNGCTAVSAVNIQQDIAHPVASIAASPELTCKVITLDVDATASSTGPLFNYSWTAANGGNIISGANTLNPQINQPGTYTLLISNSFNACTTTAQIVITQDIAIPAVDAGPPGLITCTNATVPLSGTGSTGAVYTYAWTTQNGNIASGANSLQALADAPGNYQLLITNTYNGCTATDNVQVNKDANVPSALTSVNGELNCLVNSIQLDGTSSTQGSTITYTWTTSNGNIVSGANTLTPVVDKPGQYVLQIFNTANNCLATSTVNLNQNLTPPVADAGNPAVISCQQPILTLDGTGSSSGANFLYDWNTLNGNIISGENTLNPQIDESGFYDLIVTDISNGCTASNTVQIILDQNTPEAEAGPTLTLTCAVTTLSLNGTASSTGPQFSYLWTTQNGSILSGETTLTPQIGTPGLYRLRVYNSSNGCSSEDEVLINQDIAPPIALAGTSPTLTCTVLSTALNGAGSSSGNNFAYQWTTANGQILSGASTLAPVVGDPGIYQLKVTNTATGCSTTASVEVFEDVILPIASGATPGELNCTTQQLNLSGAGSSTGGEFVYQWTTTNGNLLSGETTLDPLINKPGNYKLVVTNNANGCKSTATVAVIQNITPPQVNALVNTLLTCAVTELQLTGLASGGAQGISILWTGPGIVSGASSDKPTINEIGWYYMQATDLNNGCKAVDSVLVSHDVDPPTLAIAQPAILTCFLKTVTISGTGSSIGGQFSYQWTGPNIIGGAQTLHPMVDQPGVYALTITNNANGCQSTGSTTVLQDVVLPSAQAGGGFELTCSIQQGQLNADGSSSGNFISYAWNTNNGSIVSGSATATPVVNQAGLYYLTVSNAQTGCTATSSVTVTRNTNYPGDIDFSSVNPKCDQQPGEVVFEEITGGVPPYLYSIDGGSNFFGINQFNTIQPGTYNMVVQDANGCEYQETLSFPPPVEPAVTLSPSVSIAFGANAQLTATLNIPLNQVDTIIWSPDNSIKHTNKINVVIAEPYKTTEYKVRVVNVDGCETEARVLIEVEDPNIWVPNVFSPHNQDGFNDWFSIYAAPNTIKNIHTLQVFDRWGNMVFRNDDIQPNIEKLGWDGNFRSKPMNPAVFVWWAKVELVDGREILLKGDVTLVD